MAESLDQVIFSEVCEMALEATVENGGPLEEAVNAFLLANPALDLLRLESLPKNQREWRILDALGASQRIEELMFSLSENENTTTIPLVFDRFMPTKSLCLSVVQISPDTAEAIVDRLQASQVYELLLKFPDFHQCGHGMMNALVRLLQGQSPLRTLTLACEENNPMPESSFLAFCSAMASSRLKSLTFMGLVVATTNHQKIVNALAHSIVDCASLSRIIMRVEVGNTISIQDAIQGLARTDRVRNFDLFVTQEGNETIQLHDRENPRRRRRAVEHLGWWMGIVSDDDIPMNRWPQILCAARDGRHHHLATHTPLDIFYFLVQQKGATFVQTPRQIIAWRQERLVRLERTVALQQQQLALRDEQLAVAEQERDFFMNRCTRLTQLLMNQAAVTAQQDAETAQQAARQMVAERGGLDDLMNQAVETAQQDAEAAQQAAQQATKTLRQMTQMLTAASVSDVVAERGGLDEDERGN